MSPHATPLWGDTRVGNMRVRYQVSGKGRDTKVTRLHIEPHPDALRKDAQSITARDLQRIKPRDLASEHNRMMSAVDAAGLFGRPDVKPYSPEHLDSIAHIIRWTYLRRGSGLTALGLITGMYDVSQPTAYRWMARARERHPDLPRRSRGPAPREFWEELERRAGSSTPTPSPRLDEDDRG